MLDFFRYLLTKLGSAVSARTIHRLNAIVNYLEVGRWMGAHGFGRVPRLATRYALFDYVAGRLADHTVLYVEFGVYQGESIKYWSNLLKNRDARLIGFDSFEGLPENWCRDHGEGTFSTDGRPPAVPDQRVSFVKGWFDETLPGHRFPDADCLVLHLDADLYSSTRTVLHHMKERIRPGAILIFDEFSNRDHELRAFDEYLRETGSLFRAIGATRGLCQVAFERIR